MSDYGVSFNLAIPGPCHEAGQYQSIITSKKPQFERVLYICRAWQSTTQPACTIYVFVHSRGGMTVQAL